MGKIALFLVVLQGTCFAADSGPGSAQKDKAGSVVRQKYDTTDGENFEGAPPRDDFRGNIVRLRDSIASVKLNPNGFPGIDVFLLNLDANLFPEENLRDGPLKMLEGRQARVDSHLLDIRISAARARRHLELAFEDLRNAEPLFGQVRDTIKKVSKELPPLLEKNQQNVLLLGPVIGEAKVTVSNMSTSPPGSTGERVRVERLCPIKSIEPELQVLVKEIQEASEKLKKARGLVQKARERYGPIDKPPGPVNDSSGPIKDHLVEGLAKRLGELDVIAEVQLAELRARGKQDDFRSKMNSQGIILESSKWLKGSIEKAEEVGGMLVDQLNPRKAGVAKAVGEALIADRKTQEGKNIEIKGGLRINYNHKVRLLKKGYLQIGSLRALFESSNASRNWGLIPIGWEIASKERKGWWEERAAMAKASSEKDVDDMMSAYKDADDAAKLPDGTLQASVGPIAKIDAQLETSDGRSLEALPALRLKDVPKRRVERTDDADLPKPQVRNVKTDLEPQEPPALRIKDHIQRFNGVYDGEIH